jgi:hypothetical protein
LSTRASATSSPTAASDWALNLRASHRARLSHRGRVEAISVVEVPVGERGVLLELYRARYGKLPTVAAVLRALPDPADHPLFRITDSSPPDAAGG